MASACNELSALSVAQPLRERAYRPSFLYRAENLSATVAVMVRNEREMRGKRINVVSMLK